MGVVYWRSRPGSVGLNIQDTVTDKEYFQRVTTAINFLSVWLGIAECSAEYLLIELPNSYLAVRVYVSYIKSEPLISAALSSTARPQSNTFLAFATLSQEYSDKKQTGR